MINYIVVPLGELLRIVQNEEEIQEIFKKFSCDRENDLEDFLNFKAITYEKTNFGKTHLLIDLDELNESELLPLIEVGVVHLN